MSTITAENILSLIEQLPSTERAKLDQLLARQKAQQQAQSENVKPPLDKRVPPAPLPDQKAILRWLSEHSHEYAGQWVALDGERLIASGSNREEVRRAANESGAYLPLVTRIPSPDDLPFAGF
ncbi:MAG: DUF5678 domain-containing protein [Blastocatellales bacterium]